MMSDSALQIARNLGKQEAINRLNGREPLPCPVSIPELVVEYREAMNQEISDFEEVLEAIKTGAMG